MLELRYVWDCEKMEKILEFREVKEGKPVTAWQQVPLVYQIGLDDYKDPNTLGQ